MPKKTESLLPANAKYQVVDGAQFLRLRDAARLAGIHPVVLEMGQELLKRIGGSGASFALATPELLKNADAIGKQFKTGLRRYAKAMEPNRKIKLRAYRNGAQLVFWYTS